MFTKPKFYITITTTIFLSGCLPMNTDYDPKLFIEDKKALVIIRSFYKFGDSKPGKLNLVWDNQDTWFFFSTNNQKTIRSASTGTDEYFIHSIQPGKYKLRHSHAECINWKKSYFSDDMIAVGTRSRYCYLENNELGFEIKPNEIVYLGDFVFKDQYSGEIEVKDTFSEAEKVLNKKYPELGQKLKKNLLRIPNGSKFRIP